MTTGSLVGLGFRRRGAFRFCGVLRFRPPPRPPPDRDDPPARERPVPGAEPRPLAEPLPRPELPLPREPPPPLPLPLFGAGRPPPGGTFGRMTSTGSSLENSPRSAPARPLRERAELLDARVAMITNVASTWPWLKHPVLGVSPRAGSRGCCARDLEEDLAGAASCCLRADRARQRHAESGAPARLRHLDGRDPRPAVRDRQPADGEHLTGVAADAGERLRRSGHQHGAQDRRLPFLARTRRARGRRAQRRRGTLRPPASCRRAAPWPGRPP